MVKVSLVIPVYNARAHLAECLDSVLAQTLDELEVVLVDDHGSDDSIDFAHTRLGTYEGPKRFVFCETAVNAGPGAARNLGIEKASGTYVGFLDSDDTLDPGFCASLYEAASKADADLAFGSIVFEHPDGATVLKKNPAVESGAFTGKAKKRYLCRFTSYFTTYLYRRSLLTDNQIRFPDTHSAEDSCFLICSLLSAGRIASDETARYHYHIYGSSTSQRRDPARWKNRLASFRTMAAYAREKGLYHPYRHAIRLMILKKGWILAAKDYLVNNLSKHKNHG